MLLSHCGWWLAGAGAWASGCLCLYGETMIQFLYSIEFLSDVLLPEWCEG